MRFNGRYQMKKNFEYAITILIGLYWNHQHTLIEIQKLWNNESYNI